MSERNAAEQSYIDALSQLTLNPENSGGAYRFVVDLSDQERSELLSLADSNHVILRALKPVYEQAARAKSLPLAAWAENSMTDERNRIANMLDHMVRVCNGLEAAGCPTTVMKTLDHWPDIGNDIDMYSTASDERIVEVMKRDFGAEIEPRSWGDRLAHKWNFAIPGLKSRLRSTFAGSGRRANIPILQSASSRAARNRWWMEKRFGCQRRKSASWSRRCSACTGTSTSASATS
jgi:hypothetical protein